MIKTEFGKFMYFLFCVFCFSASAVFFVQGCQGKLNSFIGGIAWFVVMIGNFKILIAAYKLFKGEKENASKD